MRNAKKKTSTPTCIRLAHDMHLVPQLELVRRIHKDRWLPASFSAVEAMAGEGRSMPTSVLGWIRLLDEVDSALRTAFSKAA